MSIFDRCEVIDILAIIFFCGGVTLKLTGNDGVADLIIVSVISFYFGHKIGRGFKNDVQN
jgi:hypothetical protein